jgi:hypothetical protein
MLELTGNAKAASQKITVTPTIVFEIADYSTLFTSASISKYIRIGDPGLEIGDDWVIGGVRLIDGQSTYMSFTAGGGTTTKITQKLSPDRAQGSSISSMVISMIDKNEELSRVISPGFELEDVLGRDVTVSIGFVGTSYPEDYNIVFRGIISDVESGPGFINFLLASSEEKKRRSLLNVNTTELDGAMGAGAITSFNVIDASSFPQTVNGPNGSPDSSIQYVTRIDDEVFRYTSITSNTLNGITRSYLGTIATTHDNLAEVSKGIRLQGTGIDLALKIMLSGWNGYFVENVAVEIINNISISEQIDNAIFFDQINVIEKYGLSEGDWVTISGAINGSNNFTMRQIASLDATDNGSYIIVDGAPLVTEFVSTAIASFRSKYDSLGIGLKMTPAEVDVDRHEFIRDTFLSTFTFDFTEFEIQVTKDFIEKELYLPMACFSVPRQGRSSVTYTIGPLATTFVQTLDTSNVKNANALRVKRSIASNFSNTIQYQYDHDLIDGEYAKTKEFSSEESKTRIPIGDKTLRIQSKGMKTSLSAESLSTLASERLLGRYRFGAEFINGVQMLYGEGYPIEIGDVVLVDYASLKLTDFNTGDRRGEKKYMEVINKTLDNKTGEVSLDLLNTAFEFTDRYGVISPSSKLDSGSTTAKLLLVKSWGTENYDPETEKWEDYIDQPIIVHSADWTFQEETTIKALGTTHDAIIIDPPLSLTPSAGYIVDIPYYPTSVDPDINATLKAMHAFFSPNIDVVTGVTQTKFTVSPADFPKFLLGAIVRINNFSYSDYSPEAEVVGLSIGTFEIEIDTPSGFTINNTHDVKLIGFADSGYSYRFI